MRAATLTIEPLADAVRLRLDVPERDTGEPLVREFRQSVDAATLRALEASAATLFHTGVRPGFADDARRAGMILYRTLVPEALRDDLRALRAPLVVASSITGLPWELVHDGDEFWGLRYALGTRLVLDRPAASRAPSVRHARPRALVIGADPAGDLPHLEREIGAVCDALEGRAELVCVADRLATFDRVLAHLGEGFDIVHFAGHVVADDGGAALLLGDGRRLPASVIEANLVGRPLVYVNGCASAGTAAATAGVAHAFLHGGALAVVGTVADVADEHAATLATAFYREALGGAPLGNALREARAQVRERAAASPAWLSVVLYGNPAHGVLRGEVAELAPRRAAAVAAPPAVPARPSRVRPAIAALVVVLAVLAAVVGRDWWHPPARPVAVGVMDVRARGAGVPDWMRTMTRDTLNTILSRVPAVQVFSRQKIEFLREKRGLTEMEAAEALGMSKLLAASVGADGAQVSIEVEVVDMRSGLLEDTARVQGSQDDLLGLETELALRVLTALGVHPTADELKAIVAERRDATVEAYRLLTETLGGGSKRPAPPPASGAPTTPGPGSSWMTLGAPAYAEAPDREESAIHDLLRRYAEALQAKEPDALAALQVEMDDAQRASLARYFAIAKDLKVQVRDVDPLVEGGEAVVTFTREDAFTDAPSGRAMHLEVRVSGRLVRQDGAWKIKSLGDKP
jgi:TolB-like protein